MIRIDGQFFDYPGQSSHLSQENINDESDWHDAFKERMESAGWSLKHEEVCNDNNNRADFLAYHSELNRSYDDGEWVGFELKYSDSRSHRTRASQIVQQIEDKYSGESYLSSGEEVDLWVVAPYVEYSHTGKPQHMMASRHREIEAGRILSAAGYGYLHSWHPVPNILFDNAGGRIDPFPEYDTFVSAPNIPAFDGSFDPWAACKCDEHELERQAELTRLKHSGSGEFATHFDERSRIRERYRGIER